MAIALYRIDDRLIHGQVVVGWGQPLDLQFIILIDDEVAESDWEQELYRLGVPPHMSVHFLSVDAAVQSLPAYQDDDRVGMVLTGDIDTMMQLVMRLGERIRNVNLGGVHHAPGRSGRLRYVFLAPAEEKALREIAQLGVRVTAQDLPGASPVPLDELLQASTDA